MAGPFTKSYTLVKREFDGAPQYWADRQVNDVRSSAMQQGLRPTGGVTLESTTDDGRSVVLTYSVPVEVALGADAVASGEQAYEVQHAKVSPADNAGQVAAVKANVDPDAVDRRMAEENLSPAAAVKAVKAGGTPEPRPGLSPYKVEPSTGNSEQVEPKGADTVSVGTASTASTEDAPGETAGERQTDTELAEKKGQA